MSTDDVPPSSQPASNLRIFFYQPDVPIPVFVEASSIRNRPKLIRSLRNSGALICHDPAEAHIILVDSTTDPGIQFIRDWGTDPVKFVLESSWARKCIEAGRVLLQNDNWGDSVARDDGRSISGTNDREELTAKSPLPTPRPTPSDAEPSSTKRDRSHSTRPNPDPQGRVSNGEDVHEPSSSPSASQGQKIPPTQTNPQFQPPPSQQQSSSQQFPYLAPRSQQFPYSQPAPQPQQFQPQIFPPQYSQSQQSQLNSFSSNQFSNPFLMSAALQMPQFPQTGQGMGYSSQMIQNYMGQPNGQPNGPYDAQMFFATLMDVARQQGFQMPLGVPQQMPNNMLQHTVPDQQFQNNGMPPPGQGQKISSSFPDTLVAHDAPDGSSHLPTSAAPQSSSPEIWAPSIRRRSPLPSTPSPPPPPPPPSRSKGKEKALAPRQNSFKRKRSESSDESEEEEESFITPPRHRQTNDPQVLSPRKLGEIFRSDSGESLLFFVQVDLMGRHGVVQNIKKNGGKMGGSINDADYVILGNTLSKTFPDLLAQTTSVNKLPLRSAFIIDCVKHAALLDVDNYVLEEYTPPKKRGRPSVVTVKAEKPKEKKEPRKMTPKKLAIQPMEQIRYDGPPSPTPPPLSTRIELSGGHFRFSDEEVNFFKRYARHLLEMDHLISNTAVFKRLHEKMPHHSPPSWGAYIRRVCPDELDTIRKKVGIARRKTADAGSNSQTNASGQVQNEAGPSKRSSPAIRDSMSGVEATTHPDPQQQDFQDICQFFATGGGEDSDDEVVWASLASHQLCRSAASWPEYYQSRVDEITKEIERLIEEATADEAGNTHRMEV